MANMAPVIKIKPKKPETKAVKTLKIVGLVLLYAVLGILLVNSLLCIFADGYYPTWGRYRLFAIVSDSMEPTIKTGNMIATTKPVSPDEIRAGTVITFEYRQNTAKILLTHRVVSVNYDDKGALLNYTTRGDNAPGDDAYRPKFDDVVGIFGDETKQCGFFGYMFGFLQSTEGTIAIILTLMIALIAYIVVKFVNVVNTWRQVAVAALKKSGELLVGTENEDLITISDVIGIVTKDPATRAEQRRKDKKLDWFIRTGMLPKRPYSDDLELDLANLEGKSLDKIVYGSDKPTEQAEPAPQPDASRIVTENNEKVTYSYSFMAKLSQLVPHAKEWYSAVKNKLLSFMGVKVRSGNKFETFSLGRKTVARLTVRGKTLCVMLAIDPATCAKKYAVEECKSNTPCLYRLKNARRVKYANELIEGMMTYFKADKNADYVAADYYVPYEGVVTLMNKNLVKRRLRTASVSYKVSTDGQITSTEDVSVSDEQPAEQPSQSDNRINPAK